MEWPPAGYSNFNQLKFVDEEEEQAGSISSEASSIGSLESDFEEAANSPSSSPKSTEPLQDMSSLLQQLPCSNRGLSKHYQGKSQSFTCLKEVTCLEDLAKPENPYNKKLKSSRSYAAICNNQPTKSSCSKRNNNRPPIQHPHRSASTNAFSNHTALFA
ncbi:uncharacterized protein LOC123226442 isoform X1 [Mangifera indica]|uniref:uncharacterized protein LOC123226442 isoform X1 n=1 Tax=Mangifera indica TaxID=29780 RepID=UPI001CFB1C2D|nr:uncharacterized protein LOC123226442 isoform X1 [Mangifera indica]